eukprot:scaffold9272_cov195-Amphora_coffeaeformis.AAC.13
MVARPVQGQETFLVADTDGFGTRVHYEAHLFGQILRTGHDEIICHDFGGQAHLLFHGRSRGRSRALFHGFVRFSAASLLVGFGRIATAKATAVRFPGQQIVHQSRGGGWTRRRHVKGRAFIRRCGPEDHNVGSRRHEGAYHVQTGSSLQCVVQGRVALVRFVRVPYRIGVFVADGFYFRGVSGLTSRHQNTGNISSAVLALLHWMYFPLGNDPRPLRITTTAGKTGVKNNETSSEAVVR